MRLAAITAVTALLATPLLAGGIFDEDDCRYTASRNASTPAAGITKVVIHGESGFLKVDGTAGATQVGVTGTACTSEDDFLERMTLKLHKSGSELHITADIPEKTVIFGFFTARLDFAVTLPAGMPVEIEDGSGMLRVSNTGPTEIDDGSGEMQVRNIRGALKISDGSGSIEVDTVAGNVEIEDGSGEITVKNVAGNVELEDGSGAILVSKVEGSVRVEEDGSGAIVVKNIRRDLTIDDDGSGGVAVADIGGNFTVSRKSSGGIDHERVSGRVRVPSRD